MGDIESSMPDVYLRPGEMHLARTPTTIRTILGSCVGITFWCSRLGVGALCHAMLPRLPLQDTANSNVGGQYVDFCIHDLSRQFDALGAVREEVEVKLFGGADVLFVDHTLHRRTVGRQNSDTALEILNEEGYRVVAASLGDTFGRKIRFHTGSGDVELLRLV